MILIHSQLIKCVVSCGLRTIVCGVYIVTAVYHNIPAIQYVKVLHFYVWQKVIVLSYAFEYLKLKCCHNTRHRFTESVKEIIDSRGGHDSGRYDQTVRIWQYRTNPIVQ